MMVPHVLEAVFERVDGRRELLADALAPDTPGDRNPAVVEDAIMANGPPGLDLHGSAVEAVLREAW